MVEEEIKKIVHDRIRIEIGEQNNHGDGGTPIKS
jgi:hypothetical protein